MTDTALPHQPLSASSPSNVAGLKRTKSGKPASSIYNAMQVLLQTPATQGLFAFNLHRRQVEVLRPLRAVFGPCATNEAGEFDEVNLAAVRAWFTAQFDMDVSAADMCAAIAAVAQVCTFNPVTSALDRCAESWDSQSRLDTWLARYLGASEAAGYLRDVGRNWFIGAVQRAFEPGSETLPLHLIGPDSARVLQILVDAIYPSGFSRLPFRDSDIAQAARGALLVALDVNVTRRRTADRLGAFLAAKEDEVRHPTTRRYELIARRATYVMTSPQPSTLPLPVWPVTLGKVDFEALRRDAGQLWAEAVHATRAGARARFTLPDGNTQIERTVLPYADAAARVVAELRGRPGWQYNSWPLVELFGIAHPGVQTDRWSTADQRRFASALRREGMIPKKKDGFRRWLFHLQQPATDE